MTSFSDGYIFCKGVKGSEVLFWLLDYTRSLAHGTISWSTRGRLAAAQRVRIDGKTIRDVEAGRPPIMTTLRRLGRPRVDGGARTLAAEVCRT